jgi:hypothetical protein
MSGDGPHCPYCQNATAEFRENPEAFDIHEHVQRCSMRRLPMTSELTGSDPEFTGQMSTEEYVRWMRE